MGVHLLVDKPSCLILLTVWRNVELQRQCEAVGLLLVSTGEWLSLSSSLSSATSSVNWSLESDQVCMVCRLLRCVEREFSSCWRLSEGVACSSWNG